MVVELIVGSKILGGKGREGLKAWIGQSITLGDVERASIDLKMIIEEMRSRKRDKKCEHRNVKKY